MQGWEKALAVAGGVAGLALVAWPAVFWYEVHKLEKPKYTVVRPLAKPKSWLSGWRGAEIRKYAPYLIAEVTISEAKNMRDAMSQGFRQVAGYIFGKNSAASSGKSEKVAMTSPVRVEMADGKGQQIAMTSPVATEMVGNNTYKVSFVMPSKYTKDTLPTPHNSNIKIQEVPGRMVAVLGFRGKLPSEQKVDAHKQELLDLIKAEGLEVVGDPMLYQYHPPFAPGFIRLNEVLFNIREFPMAPVFAAIK